jgi:hypothetical protein
VRRLPPAMMGSWCATTAERRPVIRWLPRTVASCIQPCRQRRVQPVPPPSCRAFVSHPILFLKEQAVLAAQGSESGTIYGRSVSPVTTPYDMMINQIVEQERGRSAWQLRGRLRRDHRAQPDAALRPDRSRFGRSGRGGDRLDAIRRDYAPARLARLGLARRFRPRTPICFSRTAMLEHLRRRCRALSG